MVYQLPNGSTIEIEHSKSGVYTVYYRWRTDTEWFQLFTKNTLNGAVHWATEGLPCIYRVEAYDEQNPNH